MPLSPRSQRPARSDPVRQTDPSTARARERSVRVRRGTVRGRLRAQCLAVPHPARPASAACLRTSRARGDAADRKNGLATGFECRQRIAAKPSGNCTLSRRVSRGNHAGRDAAAEPRRCLPCYGPFPQDAHKCFGALKNPCRGAARHRSRHGYCEPPRHRRSERVGRPRSGCQQGSAADRQSARHNRPRRD